MKPKAPANSSLTFLLSLLEDATAHLPGITPRRMFGSDTLFVHSHIFALVWRAGRIGLKLPDPAVYAEFLELAGAEPWMLDGKTTMSSWVLVPESFHDEPDGLREWALRSYHLVSNLPPKAAKKPKKSDKNSGKKASENKSENEAEPELE